MKKPLPNWDIWLNMPTLTTHQAVCLSFGIDPAKVYASDKQGNVWGWSANHMFTSLDGFSDRRTLFTACHVGAISPTELARWAQAVRWNIPLRLAALAPLPTSVFQSAPDDVIESAIRSVIAVGVDVDDLTEELEKAGCRLIQINGDVKLHIQDGTVAGKFETLDNMYSAIVGLCDRNERIGHLVKALNSSGGGAPGSAIDHSPILPASPAAPEHSGRPRLPFLAEVVSTKRELPQRATMPPPEKFSLRKLERADVLSEVIFSVLKDARSAGKPLPSARQVMRLCIEKNPIDIAEVTHDEIKFLNSDGDTELANLEAVQKRIKRMTKF